MRQPFFSIVDCGLKRKMLYSIYYVYMYSMFLF